MDRESNITEITPAGRFRDYRLEKVFRENTWPPLIRKNNYILPGAVSLLVLETARAIPVAGSDLFLFALLRGAAIVYGIALFLYSHVKKDTGCTIPFYPFLFSLFILASSITVTHQAVVSGGTGNGSALPFTLFAVIFVHILFPLSHTPVFAASALSSSIYAFSMIYLYGFNRDTVYIVLLLLVLNSAAVILFMEFSRNKRYQFLAYREIRELYSILSGEITKKDRLNRQLSFLADTDELTGVANRRKFTDYLSRELEKASRYKQELSLIMFDIDFFKKINDTHGHAAGDSVLREIARRSCECLRKADLLARVGGEEFAVILPETGKEGACILAERIRDSFCSKAFCCPDGSVAVTASFGVASLSETESADAKELAGKADEALYKAKKTGRNRICCFENFSCI